MWRQTQGKDNHLSTSQGEIPQKKTILLLTEGQTSSLQNYCVSLNCFFFFLFPLGNFFEIESQVVFEFLSSSNLPTSASPVLGLPALCLACTGLLVLLQYPELFVLKTLRILNSILRLSTVLEWWCWSQMLRLHLKKVEKKILKKRKVVFSDLLLPPFLTLPSPFVMG